MQHLITGGMTTESAAHLTHLHPGALETAPNAPVRQGELLTAAFRLDVDTVLSILDTHLITDGVIATWDEFCRPALTELTRRSAPDGVDQCIDVEHLLSWAITTPCIALPCHLRHPVHPYCWPAPTANTTPCPSKHCVPPSPSICYPPAPSALPLPLPPPPSQPPVALVLWARTTDTADPDALHSLADTGITTIAAGPGWGPQPAARASGAPAQPARRTRPTHPIPIPSPQRDRS